jgi:transcriptional regulator with XRE-family HTH domain
MDKKFRQIIAAEAAKVGSLNRLCRLAGVPQSSVSEWLRGKSGLSWSVVCRLADYLCLDLAVSDRESAK